MKAMRLLSIVMLLALLLASAGQVDAQKNKSKCAPLSPEAVEEIVATRGSAIQKYCPDYAVLGIAVAKAAPLTRAMVDEIAATRGTAASKFYGQKMVVIIPVTSSARNHAPTVEELKEIIATRGQSLMGTQGK